MASGPHTFVIVGVFSAEQFQGNSLPIVAVRGNAIDQQRKRLIAREFGYSATVFIHDAPNTGIPRRIEIITGKGEEVSFSGHCVLGTAHYIFQCCEPSIAVDNDKPLTAILMTKAGPVPVLYNARRKVVACSVLNVQPQIQIVPTIHKTEGKTFPVVSIVKGMTFSLVNLSESPEILAALAIGKAPEVELDKDWDSGYVGALYYKQNSALKQDGEPTIHAIEARVIAKGTEDPGTGSACCALACYLALYGDDAGTSQKLNTPSTEKASEDPSEVKIEDEKQGTQRHVYAIQQGLEMGRACMIAVEVEVIMGPDNGKELKTVTLSGRASFFVRGELMRT